MNKISVLITYALLVIMFAVLFKYGVYISFGTDTGFIGPIFIWHAILMIVAVAKSPVKK